MIHMPMARSSLELGIENYLKTRATPIQSIVTPHAFEDVLAMDEVPGGTWIFAGICTLTPSGRQLASNLHTSLQASGCRVLNDPVRSLRRYDLLQAMYDAGVNQFRAVRAADYAGGLRFPVFIRNDARHNGSISALLHSESDVRRTLFSLRLRGEPLDDMLVVEFRDLSVNGVFRKFSAFRIGDRILPRHAQLSARWMVKAEIGDRSPEAANAESAYIESNPHEELLAPLFEMAKIEYGRMDYGYRDGRVEVWEINTAPTLGRNPRSPDRPGQDVYRAMVQPAYSTHHARFCRAMEAVNTESPSASIHIDIDRTTLAACRREEAGRIRREAMVRRLHSAARVPGLRFAWKSIETAGRRLVG